ncbi:MAG TPA: DUF4157 domain-containing protein, partial [Haliangium sp.]|nr:DUF4157 domain-containing protein [Haliangium sp.]
MSRERSFRGSRDGRERELDWYELARERGIPHRQAQRIYDAARELAGPQGEDQVLREIYVGLLDQARPAARRPSPGKVTHTMRRQSRKDRRAHRAGPGKVTLTSYLGLEKNRSSENVELPAEARQMLAWLASVSERIDTARASQALRDAARTSPETSPESWFETVLDLVLGRMPSGSAGEQRAETGEAGEHGAGAAEAGQGRAMPLPDDVRARMERVFGHDFRHVQIVPDSDRATGPTLAVTQGTEVHFARDRFQPGTAEGDWLIGHELAHVVQGMGRAGARQAPSPRSLEVEADQAATLAARGQAAAVSMYAPAGAAMAYSETEAEQRDSEEEEEEERRRQELLAREQQRALEGQLRGQQEHADPEGQTPITQIPTMIGQSASIQAAVQARPSFAAETMNFALREAPISGDTQAAMLGVEAARAAIVDAERSAHQAFGQILGQSVPGAEAALQVEDVLAEVDAAPGAAAAAGEAEATAVGTELESAVDPGGALAA